VQLKNPFKVFIIDDEKGNAEIVKQSIGEKWPEADVRTEDDFTKGITDIGSFRPDIVVLDLYKGSPVQQKKNDGELIWRDVWNNHFSPIIIHTAGEPTLSPSLPDNHPFVRVVTKSKTSDQDVVNIVEAFLPHIDALNTVRNEFSKVTQQILKTTCEHIWDVQSDMQLRTQMLLRTARRHMGALMDMNTLAPSEKLISWEQYIFPPLEPSLLAGDILHETGKPMEEPESYSLILTPSCDLAIREDGNCNVTQVMIAKCTKANEYVKRCQASTTKEEDFKKKIKVQITQAQVGGYILLPEYPSILPLMAANLRSLSLIPIGDISVQDGNPGKFKRIASIDSPFREQIVWAYMQIACRPGVPESDLDRTIADMWKSLKENQTA
jgi:CTP synthase